MKLKILGLFLLVISTVWSQNNTPYAFNNKRLLLIPSAIESAVNSKKYLNAAHLKEEQSIRKKMQLAFEEENYERLSELKEELEECDCLPTEENLSKTPTDESISMIIPKEKNYRHNRFIMNFDFSPLAYIKGSYNTYTSHAGIGNVYNTMDVKRISNDYEGGGIRIGGTVFFDRKDIDKNFKIGFDIIMVSFSSGLDFRDPNHGVIYFSLGQPGIALKYYLNDKSGFNFRYNIGNAIVLSDMQALALGMHTRLAYWFKNFSIGIEYQFINGLDDSNSSEENVQLHHLGINCGFHF